MELDELLETLRRIEALHARTDRRRAVAPLVDGCIRSVIFE